jgi:hypothetical protein
VRLVIEEDVGIEEIKGLTNITITKTFVGRKVNEILFVMWVELTWSDTLGYILVYHILFYGWLAFEF